MSVDTRGTNDTLTNKQWAEGTEIEFLSKTSYAAYMGEGANAVFENRHELANKKGDRIRTHLLMNFDGVAPLTGKVEGNERTLTFHDLDTVVGRARQAVRWDQVLSAQRINTDQRSNAQQVLSNWGADYVDQVIANQMGGYTPESNSALGGFNTIVAPDSDHHVFVGSTKTDEGQGAGDTFELAIIDEALERAKTISPLMRPASLPGVGMPMFVCFIHPYHTTALRATGTQWEGIQRDLLKGGFIEGNPLFNGALGIYNGVLLVENKRVTQGVDSGDATLAVAEVRRAVLCGAQAGITAWGQIGGDPNRFQWVEKDFDYEEEAGIHLGMLWGFQKTQYNSKDYGSIVISARAEAS
jgi:N4-gp56 family major capsid protein